jgi:hypothetical protein
MEQLDSAQKDASKYFNSEVKWIEGLALAGLLIVLLSHFVFGRPMSNWWWLIIPAAGCLRVALAIEADFRVLKVRSQETNSRLKTLEAKIDAMAEKKRTV